MDDLVSQVHMLETSKMKLELEITQMKKDFRREIQTKEDDLEDIRLANNKKVKVLEQQLEQEHEERMGQVRDKHELEAKVQSLQDLLDRSGDEEVLTKLRRDLKRTKALLKDAQMYMEKNQSDGTNKVIVRQLKNQVFIIVNTSAANRLIGEVVQSRRRPLLGPSPGRKRLLPLSHLRHYAKWTLTPQLI